MCIGKLLFTFYFDNSYVYNQGQVVVSKFYMLTYIQHDCLCWLSAFLFVCFSVV